LGEAVVFESIPNESGGGVGLGVGDFEGIPWNGGWFQFHGWLGLVGVLDADEVDVFHFCVFPLEGDTPWGFAGVCINRVLGGAFEIVVVEERGKKQGLLVRLIQERETLDGFGGVETAEGVDFLAAECLAEEEFFSSGICKTPDHGAENTRKDEAGKRDSPFSVFFTR